ncbi:hypothetical protein [Citrobacter pasteurii]|nr:hypothetical protein SF123566_8023 [Shigella flexneri 1235-66]CEJ64790.1 hypothetical protein [Citrobacter pasteurii]
MYYGFLFIDEEPSEIAFLIAYSVCIFGSQRTFGYSLNGGVK